MIRIFKFSLLIVFLSHYGWTQTNIPPIVEAIGDQLYCPLSEMYIVTDFDIIDPDDTEIDILKINISDGYVIGEDLLTLKGNHPNILAAWNENKGRLTLSDINGKMML